MYKKLIMIELIKTLDEKEFVKNLFFEISKLPFGSLPKIELELAILHSIIESNGGYKNLNSKSLFLQDALKLSQTKFKNKVIEAQLRYDKAKIKVEDYLKNTILETSVDELIIEEKYLVLYISNPLLLDNVKTYFDSKQIVNDTSFNKNIVKIENKGLLKILIDILDDKQLIKIEDKFKEEQNLKNINFNLINKLSIESIFSASIDPLESVVKFIGFIRNTLN
jgi:hypothetical protein